MRRSIGNTNLRALAIAVVLFAQLQLLWVAAVHGHELPPEPASAAVQSAGHTSQPAPAGTHVQCPVCQLARHNVARIAALFSALRPDVSVRSPRPASPLRSEGRDSPVLGSRAPPLS